MGALLGAIAGALLGAYLQERGTSEPTPEDEEDLLRRLDRLEAEIEELEIRRRERKREAQPAQPARQASPPVPPQPYLEVRGKPPQRQYLVLTADRDFRLSRIDYVSNRGATVVSEDVDRHGRRIEVPINEQKVSRIWYLGPRVNEAPTQFEFRCHLNVDGVETQSVIPAVIEQERLRIGQARTIFRNVTLNR
jgi:hypothetical protein